MADNSFLARCHPHMLSEGQSIDTGQCKALADDMADLRSMGIILTLVGSYAVGPYKYSSLEDALAQVRRDAAPDDDQ